MRDVKDAMFQGHYRIVYVTPEYASTAIDQFKKLDQNVGKTIIGHVCELH